MYRVVNVVYPRHHELKGGQSNIAQNSKVFKDGVMNLKW